MPRFEISSHQSAPHQALPCIIRLPSFHPLRCRRHLPSFRHCYLRCFKFKHHQFSHHEINPCPASHSSPALDPTPNPHSSPPNPLSPPSPPAPPRSPSVMRSSSHRSPPLERRPGLRRSTSRYQRSCQHRAGAHSLFTRSTHSLNLWLNWGIYVFFYLR